MFKKTSRILIIGLLTLFALAGFCYAISYGGLGIYPNQSEWDEKNPLTKSWFIYKLDPGEIKQGKVDVINQFDKPVEVEIYAVDAVTTKDGAFAPQSEDRKKIDVGAWINLEKSELSLGPKETKTVDFVLKVPENAEVGDHMGAILVQGKESEKAGKGTAMQVKTRVGVRIYLTVLGEMIEKMELTGFSYKTEKDLIVFELTLENKGNVRISPKGEIEIKDKSGEIKDKIEITEREVFPKDTIVLPIIWEKTPDSGKFTALATVRYGIGKLLTEQMNFQVEAKEFPLSQKSSSKIFLIIGSVIGGITILLVGFFWFRKKFNFSFERKKEKPVRIRAKSKSKNVKVKSK